MKQPLISTALSCLVLTGAAQADCTAPASWTSHAAVPAPDGTADFDSNCAFHTWSWNTFLWMTQTGADGSLMFESFPTPAELFAADSPAKAADLPQGGGLSLIPRPDKLAVAKGALDEDLSSIEQAGLHGILVGQAPSGADGGHVVYFSQSVNQPFYDFVRAKGYYDKATYIAAPARENFPVGVMEFKFSWKLAQEGDVEAGFFVTEAQVAKLVTGPDGNVVTDASQAEPQLVALVGAHVVGSVKDHPEMIWATFEHIGNAPDLPAGVSMGSDTPVSDQDFTFYAANTAARDANVSNGGTVAFTDADAQLVGPVVNAVRQFAWGSDDSSAGQSNASDIQSLNASVATQVLADDPIWKNYQLIGSVWGPPNTLLPNQNVTPQGSTKLSNATIETFTQANQQCFSCHSTFAYNAEIRGKNLNLSHLFSQAFAN